MIRRLVAKFVAGLALCLLMVAPAAAQDRSVVVVDLAMVSQVSRVSLDADAQLQALFGDERTELEAAAAELNAQYEELNAQSAVLSESAVNSRLQELQTRAQELDARSMEYSRRLNTVQQSLTLQMQEVLSIACSDFALRNEISLIIDAQASLYANPALDATAGIIEEVDRVWQARGSKFTLPN